MSAGSPSVSWERVQRKQAAWKRRRTRGTAAFWREPNQRGFQANRPPKKKTKVAEQPPLRHHGSRLHDNQENILKMWGISSLVLVKMASDGAATRIPSSRPHRSSPNHHKAKQNTQGALFISQFGFQTANLHISLSKPTSAVRTS